MSAEMIMANENLEAHTGNDNDVLFFLTLYTRPTSYVLHIFLV